MAKNEDECWMWRKRLGHASMHVISKLSQKDLVVGLPKLSFENDKVCDACIKENHRKTSFKPKTCVSTTRSFQLTKMLLIDDDRRAWDMNIVPKIG